jgi:hypothetical protein
MAFKLRNEQYSKLDQLNIEGKEIEGRRQAEYDFDQDKTNVKAC